LQVLTQCLLTYIKTYQENPQERERMIIQLEKEKRLRSEEMKIKIEQKKQMKLVTMYADNLNFAIANHKWDLANEILINHRDDIYDYRQIALSLCEVFNDDKLSFFNESLFEKCELLFKNIIPRLSIFCINQTLPINGDNLLIAYIKCRKRKCDVVIIFLLLEGGIKLYHKNNKEESAMSIAIIEGLNDICKIFNSFL
jgi:hypothetical protein